MKRLLSCLLLLAAYLPVALADHVEPLLGDWVRHQKAPFNRYCPYAINDKGQQTPYQCVVGCVATALESILSYHRQVITLHETLPAWSSKTFATEDIPAGTTVDTRLILADYGDGTAESVGMSEEDYEASVDAVARLSLMCGMAAQMNWGIEASGADADNLVEPLKTIFGWKTAEYIDSYKYTPRQWRELLKNELRNGRPVLYTGYTMNIDGHAFVIDGFDEQDRFHVNWGYGGYYDENYYDITQLCPFAHTTDTEPLDVQQGFFCNQQALIISPDEIDTSLIADSLHRTGQEIVIERVSIDEAPLTKKFTPVTLTLHNTAEIPLCSPFEIFTNGIGDKDLFKEGDYGALFGVNLEPDERVTLTVHCRFDQKGVRTLHVSPDDVTVMLDKQLNLTPGKALSDLVFDAVAVDFTPDTEGDPGMVNATFSVPVHNTELERSGDKVTYCLMGNCVVTDGDWRHFDYLYLPASSSATKQVTFKHLKPGDEHLFLIRHEWDIRQSYSFVVPEDTPVGLPSTLVLTPDSETNTYYDFTGRRAAQASSGILIHNGRKILHR